MTLLNEAEVIHHKLRNLRSLDHVRELITALGFSYADEPLSTRNFKKPLKEAIEAGSLRIIGRAATYPVIFLKKATTEEGDIDRQLIRLERELIKKLPPELQDASIVIAASSDFKRIHFINAKRIGSRLILRRYLIGPDQNMRTAAERLSYLKLEGISRWDKVIERVEDAFDREVVTEKFFKDFEGVFKTIKDEIVEGQKKDEHIAHRFLHALLNRLCSSTTFSASAGSRTAISSSSKRFGQLIKTATIQRTASTKSGSRPCSSSLSITSTVMRTKDCRKKSSIISRTLHS